VGLSRRSLLKAVATGAAAAAGSFAGGGVLRRTRLWIGNRGVPALAAAPDAARAGTLVRLSGLPDANGDAAVAYAAAPPRPGVEGAASHRWVMLIDLARCDGCRECTRACTATHFVPPGQEWIRIFEMRNHEEAAAYWLPRPCMQCDNPPCVKVCPVSATWKREDGIVMQDTSRCIGCRFCMAACPYQARSFNWVDPPETEEERREPYSPEWNRRHFRGTTEKCIFCPALVSDGKLPACVAACPMGAIYFGDQVEDAVTNSQDETVRLSDLIGENASYRLMEDLGTEPRVYYLPARKRIYPAPPAEPSAVGGGHR
jgi:molybdopterin-containing oxidoreductase family iron-sulfur binding subunit